MWTRSFVSFLLFVCVTVCEARTRNGVVFSQNEGAATSINTESSSRGLFNFLSLLFSVQAPCPKHGPLSHHCHDHDHHHHDNSHSSSGGSSNTNDDDSSTGNNGDDNFNWNDPDFDDYDFGHFSTQEESTGSSTGTTSVDDFSIWMLVAAGAAAFVAAGAILLGQRTRPTKAHPLAGSVARRMELFGNFANSALCSENRPGRVVELTASVDDYRIV